MRVESPSPSFLEFAEEFGPVLTEFDPLAETALLPGFIAARGRHRSFIGQANPNGDRFESAGCFYINCGLADARAATTDNGFCFTVFDVIPFQLLDLFSMLLSIPGFLPEVGDSSKEDVGRVRAREKPAGYGLFRKQPDHPIPPREELAYPVCLIREQAALYLVGMALDLIWSHELGHAFMGHLDYASDKLGIRAMNEQPEGGGSTVTMPLEVEADRFGVTAIVSACLGRVPYLPKSLTSLDVASRVKATRVVSAVTTWYWAFHQRIDREFDGMDPYITGSHPPPLSRLHFMLDSNREILTSSGWDRERIDVIAIAALKDLEAIAEAKAWFGILHPERIFSEKSRTFHQDVKAVVGDRFREMMPELEGMRYGTVKS